MKTTITKIKRIRIARRDPRLLMVTPQAQAVVRHLSASGSISGREALMDHSIQSLTRRITELRDAGFDVAGTWKKHPVTGQRYMRYTLAS